VVELLALLVAHCDRMVSKDEINDAVWQGRIVSEAALSSRIKLARQILGDDGQSQRLIRTIHKKGFRFVGEVRRIDDDPPRRRAGDLGVHVRSEAGNEMPAQAATPVPPPRNRPAVAVLPWANLSGETAQEYFSDGVTTDIITRLAKHRWLDVLARNTSFGFKGRAVDVRGLQREHGIDYVVEGAVQRAGDRVRIHVQLIDAWSGHTRWSERYDRDLQDIFAVQDEITEKVVARLEPEIGFAERHRVIHARPANLQAWDCYHLGTHHLFRFTGADNVEAQRLLRRSQELDPLLGEAHAWWAYATILGMVYWGTDPTPEGLDEALAACDRALSIDPQNATFMALRARVRLARCEYEQAIADNESAIALNPTFAAAYCGLADSLAYECRYDEAVERFRKAIELSPHDPQLWAFLSYGALALILMGEHEEALRWAERASALPNCQYWTTAHRAAALAALGRPVEAQRAVGQLLEAVPGFSCAYARRKLFYLKDRTQIEGYLGQLAAAGVPPG
ncbi:winged helix-turn-helix domain-containing tetratricopeptide repeat protein, partial [Piscinibacter sp.]|uniref:winged helix-turn-helix domain-containing tetratricopeptide repeat protein n=1 Tax=Piscinibacter sp. TaxID=1903157 RepID=UPI002D15865A